MVVPRLDVLHLVLAVLIDEALRPFVEVGAVLLRPPVRHHAGAVVLRAAVVEAVGDLVAHHHADAAVVQVPNSSATGVIFASCFRK